MGNKNLYTTNMKFIFGVVILAALAGLIFTAGSATFQSNLEDNRTYFAYLSGAPLKLTIANTPESREQGLSGLTGLPENHGLLFVFDTPGDYGIWMKDMNFSIDILWLSKDFKVVHIEDRVSPGTYPTVFYPDEPAQYVLEANAGWAESAGIVTGDTLNVLSYNPVPFSFDIGDILPW